jgi:hypothetical protein
LEKVEIKPEIKIKKEHDYFKKKKKEKKITNKKKKYR